MWGKCQKPAKKEKDEANVQKKNILAMSTQKVWVYKYCGFGSGSDISLILEPGSDAFLTLGPGFGRAFLRITDREPIFLLA